MSEQVSEDRTEVRQPEEAPVVEGTAGVRGLAARAGAASEIRNIGLIVVLLIVVGVGFVTAGETFGTASNLTTVLRSAAVIGVVTVGMTFVIIGGGIDLSVGALVALGSVTATMSAVQDLGLWPMLVVAIVTGIVFGLINGVLIAYGRVVSFIATLAMLVSARGLAQNISNKRTQIVTESDFTAIGYGRILGIPTLIIVFGVVIAIGWVVLNRTTFGRRTFAVGGNMEAARLAGIDVRRHTMWLYVLSGLCAGIAALMIAARTTTGSSTHGDLYELDAIAAVIIGGTVLAGGKGTLIGSMLGVLIFTFITNIFVLNNLSTDLQNIAKGLIIVAAVLLQARAGRGAGKAHI